MTRFLSALIALHLLAWLPSHTQATTHGVVVNLVSKHITSADTDFREQNWGIGYTYYFDDNRLAFQGGAYKNSIFNTSVYAAGKYYFTATGKLRPAVQFGLVTGYKSALMPLVVGAIDYEFLPTHKANLLVMPNMINKSINGIVLGLQYEKLF